MGTQWPKTTKRGFLGPFCRSNRPTLEPIAIFQTVSLRSWRIKVPGLGFQSLRAP